MTTTLHAAPQGETTRPTLALHHRRWLKPAGVTLIGLVAVAWPALAGPYAVGIAAAGLVLVIAACSTQLLTGIAGLPTMGQPAYLGVGAYTAALLATHGTTLAPVQLAAAILTAALAAAITAPLLLRTRGTAHLMATVALQSLVATAATQWKAVTGGDNGLHTPPITLWPAGSALTSPAYLYWYALAITLVVAVMLAVLLRSRLVQVLRGIADNETRMAALGHRVTGRLTLAYLIAAALAGAGGAVLVAVNQYVSPADLGFDTAALVLLAAAIGGSSMTGAALGALLIVLVRDGLGVSSDGLTPLLLGLLFLTTAYRTPAQSWIRERGWRR